MIKHIAEKAYGKLNLSLDVVSKRSDGYHNMKMIFQTVDLCDDVEISITNRSGAALSTNLDYLPCDATNIAVRAAEAFFKKANLHDVGAEIKLFKRIPVCAGMGGGSADGAAVLRGLNRCFEFPLSTNELLEIGRSIGADVPFCTIGGTVLGCGRGDEMTELSPLPECYLVICKPQFSVSTPELFKRIDCRKIRLRPDTNGIIEAIKKSDIYGVGRRLYNVFEDVLPRGGDKIQNIKSILHEYDAIGAAMTGTGSAVFGIFDNENSAVKAFSVLSKPYPECYLTKPVGKII